MWRHNAPIEEDGANPPYLFWGWRIRHGANIDAFLVQVPMYEINELVYQ